MTPARPSSPTAPAPIELDPVLKGRLERLADARHRSPHWLMREAIAEYVEREEKRQEMRKQAVAAWEELQSTGLHATEQEVSAWLESWGTDDELPPPEWHK
ncbi:CopG family ribbon-helix-helix protein [Variovorax sp. KK3]|uniref:CopG family ribbon-helix-helix protein n=1 Tax=Variovorax sp. KK3 TaxID=1855728 RepID=UPI00097C15FE|nr:CopG family ribbon-helix-helix protein [Variovorax sp. KK3]